jgi:hypothetical protein
LPYRCEICNDQGTIVAVKNRQISVNNPPTLYGNPTITPNNQPFPFQTQISVVAYDMENNGVLPLWYCNSDPISGAVTTGPVSVPGTYCGTLTGTNRNAYTSTLNTTIYGQGTVYVCKLVDNDGGTNLLTVPVMGFEPADPHFAIAVQPNTVTVDASTLPDAVIAPGQVIYFTAYGYDPTPGTLVYTWYFYGSNHWEQPGVPIVTNGVTTALSQGSRNDYTLSIQNEVNAGPRTALVTVTNSSTGRTAASAIQVNLSRNLAPVMTSIGLYDAVTFADLAGVVTPYASPAQTLVMLAGTATDANEDVIVYKWDLTTPALPIPNTPVSAANLPWVDYTLWGAKVFVEITDWGTATTYNTLGFCTPYDKYGQAGAAMAIPSLHVNPAP